MRSTRTDGGGGATGALGGGGCAATPSGGAGAAGGGAAPSGGAAAAGEGATLCEEGAAIVADGCGGRPPSPSSLSSARTAPALRSPTHIPMNAILRGPYPRAPPSRLRCAIELFGYHIVRTLHNSVVGEYQNGNDSARHDCAVDTSRSGVIFVETERGRRRVARSLFPVGEDDRRRDREGIGEKHPTSEHEPNPGGQGRRGRRARSRRGASSMPSWGKEVVGGVAGHGRIHIHVTTFS